MKGYRRINIDGEEWGYRVGKQFLVLRNPRGQRMPVGLNLASGMSWSSVEQAQAKRYFHLLPSQVEVCIRALKSDFRP